MAGYKISLVKEGLISLGLTSHKLVFQQLIQ